MYKHFLRNINHMMVHLYTLIVSGQTKRARCLCVENIYGGALHHNDFTILDIKNKCIKGHKSLADVNIDLTWSILCILALAA